MFLVLYSSHFSARKLIESYHSRVTNSCQHHRPAAHQQVSGCDCDVHRCDSISLHSIDNFWLVRWVAWTSILELIVQKTVKKFIDSVLLLATWELSTESKVTSGSHLRGPKSPNQRCGNDYIRTVQHHPSRLSDDSQTPQAPPPS